MRPCVVDTSVVVKWFSKHGEDDLAQALLLRDQAANGRCELIAPDLLTYELANALRFNANFTQGDVEAALASVVDMGIDCRPPAPEMIARAIQIAYALEVTLYDACFLALAEMTGGTLITADQNLSSRASSLGCVVPLRDWGIDIPN